MALACAAFALTGCTAGAPAEADDAAPTSTTTTPVATPTQAAPDPSDVSTWVISSAGIGPIERGAAYPEVATQPPGFTTDEWCPGVVEMSGADASRFTLRLTEDGAAVSAIWVAPAEPGAPAPATESGVRVGSTKAELDAAYPDLIQAGQVAAEAYVYAIGDDATGWIDFTVSDDTVTMIGVSERPLAPKELCG